LGIAHKAGFLGYTQMAAPAASHGGMKLFSSIGCLIMTEEKFQIFNTRLFFDFTA
jgi:hypothetical protein